MQSQILLPFQQSAGPEPVTKAGRPGGYRVGAGTKAVPMTALAVNMQFGRDPVALELGVVQSGKDGPVTIIMSDGNKGRWRLWIHLDQRVEPVGILSDAAKVGRIDQDHETRSGIQLVDRIY